MSTPAPTNPTATPSDPNQPAISPGFEHKLHEFWQKNSRAVYAFCAVIFLVIIGKGAYDTYARWQDDKVKAEYAAAGTSDKLKAFVAAHPGHPLAGAAKLRLADEAYGNGNYAQAGTDYQAAAEVLRGGPLGSRARLGAAMAKLQGGQAAEGESSLKLVASDSSVIKTVRAEAAYQLAAFAAQNGRTDDALKYLDQVSASGVEASSFWAQRAAMLRDSIPASGALPAPASPAKP